MNGKTILVIGGTGFIGFSFVQEALNRGFKVVSISLRSKMLIRNKNLTHFTGDLLKDDSLIEILAKNNFHYVVNLGNYIDHSDFLTGGDKILSTQIEGMLNVLANINDTSLIKYINIGSSDEYGNNKSPQDENMILQPFSPYSLGKAFISDLLELKYKTEGIPTLTLRPFLVYGPYQKLDRFLPYIITSCLQDIKFDCSSGKQIRDFCFIDDFIEAIFLAFENKSAKGKTINVASGIPISIKEITLKVIQIIGKGKPIFGKIKMRKNENMSLYANISLAKDILGWKPKIDIDDGLKKTISYYKNL